MLFGGIGKGDVWKPHPTLKEITHACVVYLYSLVGLGKNCYMSRQPKCSLEREWIGCYKDNGYQRAFPELLLTARDNTSAVYFGENINWKDWENFIDRLDLTVNISQSLSNVAVCSHIIHWKRLILTLRLSESRSHDGVYLYTLMELLSSFSNSCSAFPLSVVKPNLKISQREIRRKENTLQSRWGLRVKTTKPPKARENGFSFASNRLREWRGVFGPITEQSKQN